MARAQWLMTSEIGPLYLVASEKGLRGLYFKKQPMPLTPSLTDHSPEVRILSRAVSELKEYFEGKRKNFSVPLDMDGTAFQRKVWTRLRKIPYGQTCSYKDIAKGVNHERAFRAVGTANGENPLCIIVPCHRVISSDGTLGGYSAGLAIKKQLLKLEGHSLHL